MFVLKKHFVKAFLMRRCYCYVHMRWIIASSGIKLTKLMVNLEKTPISLDIQAIQLRVSTSVYCR